MGKSGKVLGLCTAILLVIALAAGCTSQGNGGNKTDTGAGKNESGGKQEASVSEGAANVNLDGPLPVVKSPIELSLVTLKAGNSGPVEGMWFFQFMKEKANLNFDVKQIDHSAWNEQKNIMFASNQLPDIFTASFSIDEIMRYGQIEGQLLPLNDLIDKYAPNIKKLLDEKPEVRAAITAPDGNIYSLPSIGVSDLTVWNSFAMNRFFINQKWLKQVGLQEPQTLDDFYAMLKAFKDQDPDGNGKPDSIPFTGTWTQGIGDAYVILSALGINARNATDLSVKDGKVTVAGADPLFKEYLSYMHKLNSEGLLDNEAFTQNETAKFAKSANNQVGALSGAAPFVFAPDYAADWVPLTPLTSKWNSDKLWTDGNHVTPGRIVITSKAKNPEAAIRFADLFFTELYNFIFWNGPMKDSEEALGYEGWYLDDKGEVTYNFPNGITNIWDYVNALNPISGAPLGPSPVYDSINSLYGLKAPELPESELSWRNPILDKVGPYLVAPFPEVYLTPEALARRNELATPILDYVKEMEARFIYGHESLDKFDDYLNKLKSLGLEEYLQIYQSAYDAYVANMK
ncbi:hypothetical protein B1748_35930 [Paenibacillus sp. MY03]|uniref:extracellular solute-binding protein n=1 Tax=Paenibacillus sp. MY03 TaxID=302980 RepID=UPI000B3CB6A6|nr:extracellular solute-binding protein [Paenibacillus sp. MY03]OUS67671.1 hypothetical protein B1748_35930 [Paenibacillus sp. MY03]